MTGKEASWGPEVFRLIDEHVGFRLKERREVLGLSRSKFADDLNVPAFTLVKFESGQLSIPASKLFDAANLLGIPTEYFFEGLEARVAATANGNITSFTGAPRQI